MTKMMMTFLYELASTMDGFFHKSKWFFPVFTVLTPHKFFLRQILYALYSRHFEWSRRRNSSIKYFRCSNNNIFKLSTVGTLQFAGRCVTSGVIVKVFAFAMLLRFEVWNSFSYLLFSSALVTTANGSNIGWSRNFAEVPAASGVAWTLSRPHRRCKMMVVVVVVLVRHHIQRKKFWRKSKFLDTSMHLHAQFYCFKWKTVRKTY